MPLTFPVARHRRVRVLAISLLALGVAAPSVWAMEGSGPLLPPFRAEENPRKFDWVQLENGEWLKGEFSRMHDGDLYFESDEFDNVSLGWGDVASLIPAGPVTVRLPGQRVVTGDFEMRNGAITVKTASEVVKVARADVISMTAGKQTESSYWSANASIGFSARSGNAEQSDLNLRANVMRQTTLTRTKAGYTGAISSSNDVDTANSHRVPATFDYFLTDRLFLTPVAFEYYTDEFQNIDRRITVGAGLGYDVFANSIVSWEIGAGVAYQNTGYDEVLSGSDTANDAAITFRTVVELDLPRGIEWDNSYGVQVVVTDIGKTSHHLESLLSFDIWGPLEFEAAFYFDRIEDPRATSSGTPKSNDYRMTFGLGFDI